MNRYDAQVKFWADKYFPHLLPKHRLALVFELLQMHALNPQPAADSQGDPPLATDYGLVTADSLT